MYVCTYVYVCVYIYIYIYIETCICKGDLALTSCVPARPRVRASVHTSANPYVRANAYMCVCASVRTRHLWLRMLTLQLPSAYGYYRT